jgi:subtilisin family serine protease
VLDFVFSTGNGSWYWSVGTSMAAPHAAGVAALIISETGNSNPAHVMRELRRRAVDGGKPGRDDFFGHGTTHSGYH